MDIIENIIKIRKSKGFTQKTFSEKINMPQANYARIETKETQLTIDKLEKVAEGLGVSIIELINWGGDKSQVADQEKIIKNLEANARELKSLLQTAELKIELLRAHANLHYEYILHGIYTDGKFYKSEFESVKEKLKEQFLNHSKMKKYIALNLISEEEIDEMVNNTKSKMFVIDKLRRPTKPNIGKKKK